MGATSVTGVGPGSADGMNKGSEHQTLGVNKLIGPHIVAAGKITLSGTSGAVQIPTLSGTVAEYGVFLTPSSATVASYSSFTTSGFTVTAGSGATVYWQVVKLGL